MGLRTPSSANERTREQLANDVDNARVRAAAAAIHVKDKADDARDAASSNRQELLETPWFRWRLGLLDFDQGLVGPFRSVEDGFELCGR